MAGQTGELVKYTIYSDDLELDVYAALDLQGFFVAADPEESWRSFRAVHCEQLQDSMPPISHESIEVRVLGSSGTPVGAYSVSNVEMERTSGRPGGTSDLAITGYVLDIPHPQGAAAWDRWRKAQPGELSPWAELSEPGREAWIEAARLHSVSGLAEDRPDETKEVIELDGKFITDRAGLYCAMGEAVNGPGGYFGATLDALSDCLHGGFGAVAPFELRWNSFDVARTHLAGKQVDGSENDLDSFLKVLNLAGVTVHPC